jgi:hypothetical protein
LRVALRASTQWVAGLIKIWARDIWLIKMILDTDRPTSLYCFIFAQRGVFLFLFEAAMQCAIVWQTKGARQMEKRYTTSCKWRARARARERANLSVFETDAGKNDAAHDSPNFIIAIVMSSFGGSGYQFCAQNQRAAVKIHKFCSNCTAPMRRLLEILY